MCEVNESTAFLPSRLLALNTLVIWATISFGFGDGISVEKDLSMSLKERQILSKFKQQMAPLLYQDFMKNDIYLVRWLRARNFIINDAEQMLKENIRWRKENKIDSIQSEDFTDMWQDFPATVDTVDKQGRPIVTIEMYNWDIRQAVLSGRAPRILRYLDMIMDKTMKEIFDRQQKGMNVTRWKCLLNAEGFSMIRHGCPACIPYWVAFLNSLDNHFPGYVDDFVVIDGTFAVNTMLSTMRPFLSEELRDNLRIFANKQQWMAYLDQRISRDQRRAPYGGTKP